jgi:hypothetical protein
MNKFDDIFSRKAREAFDNYNADHLAEEGWNSFTGKYGRRRSRAILIPLWARAASIAILVTAGVLLTARLNNRKAGETVNQIAQETLSEQADSLLIKEDSASSAPGISAGKPVIIAANTEISATPETTEATPSKPDATSEIAEVKPSIQTVAQELTARASSTKDPGQASEATVVRAGQTRQTANEASSTRVSQAAGPILAEAAMAQKPPSDQPASAHSISDGLAFAGRPVKIRLADMTDTGLKLKPGEAPKVYGDIPREKLTTTIMTGLSGMMASVDNATSASQGVSIGFYVEQQLTRRISVRPGLAMARHNYTVESMSGGSMDMAYSAPELNGMAATATTYDADIDVVSMEVPVNFVFSLRKRARSNLFVTTGASTVIYLSQNLSGSFNNTYTRSTVNAGTGQVEYESMTTTVQIESEQEFLSRVDLLGLANFSAGYSFPFTGTSQLLFEPFVQLPIRDLTSLNLRIWYGGLSMKIRF